jgi:hypothetical protein
MRIKNVKPHYKYPNYMTKERKREDATDPILHQI